MESLIKNAQARADRTKPKSQRIDDGEILVSEIRCNKPKFLRLKQNGGFWDVESEHYESIDWDRHEEEIRKEEE